MYKYMNLLKVNVHLEFLGCSWQQLQALSLTFSKLPRPNPISACNQIIKAKFNQIPQEAAITLAKKAWHRQKQRKECIRCVVIVHDDGKCSVGCCFLKRGTSGKRDGRNNYKWRDLLS